MFGDSFQLTEHSAIGQSTQFEYSGGLNTEHWITKYIGILKVLKFGFVMVQFWNGWS